MIGTVLDIAAALALTLGLSAVISLAATEIHERSHWLVARIWSKSVSIDRWQGVIASTVVYHSPLEIPPYGIRLSGIAPVLVGFPLGLTVLAMLDAPLSIRLLAALPFLATMILSPSDVLAILFPERFQEFAVENDSAQHREMVKLLVEEFRRDYF